jgi:hypothetical protein
MRCWWILRDAHRPNQLSTKPLLTAIGREIRFEELTEKQWRELVGKFFLRTL